MFHLFFRKDVMFPDNIPYGPFGRISFPCQEGRFFIADMWQQCRDDADTVVYPVLALAAVGFQSLQQFIDERMNGIRQALHGTEKIICHDRFHDVEFKLAVFRSEGDGQIVADDLIAGLVEHFCHDRIDFPRHDGRSAGPMP